MTSPTEETKGKIEPGFATTRDALQTGTPNASGQAPSQARRRNERPSKDGDDAAVPERKPKMQEEDETGDVMHEVEAQIGVDSASKAIDEQLFTETAKQAERRISEADLSPEHLEIHRIRTQVESRPGSPGVDPRQAVPMSAGDVAHLPGPILSGYDDPNHRAVTAHLPPREVQEQRLHQHAHADKARDRNSDISLLLPGRNGIRASEVASSPASMIALSATTPALHDASTDTSPDDLSKFEPDRMDVDEKSVLDQASMLKPSKVAMSDAQLGLKDSIRSSSSGGMKTVLSDRPPLHPSSIAADDLEVSTQRRDGNFSDIKKLEPITQIATEDVLMQDADLQQATEVPDSQESANNLDDRSIQDSFESRNSTTIKAAPRTASPQTLLDTRQHPQSTPIDVDTSIAPRAASRAASTPTSERMTTRVSSGAMERKSVSEILGETPAARPSGFERSATGRDDMDSLISPSTTSTPQHASHRHMSLADKRQRSKLSTVVFAKKARPANESRALVPSRTNLSKQTSEDYFMPLFLSTASQDKRVGMPAVDNLLVNAHKTISTSNAYVSIHESQITKILRRIYTLQNGNKWALRQPKRAEEPVRPMTHWDVLLQEAKWMRTDFREEKKWKMTLARRMAYDCAEYVAATPEERQKLQVIVVRPRAADVTGSEISEIPHSTPDLIAASDMDSPMDDFEDDLHPEYLTGAPSTIFTLAEDEVVFGLRRSPTSDKLLNELPMYGKPLMVPRAELSNALDPDRFWRRPAVPISKFVEGQMHIKEPPTTHKRSRFEYEDEDEEDDDNLPRDAKSSKTCIPPEQTNVALFDPENKHIRDRIHSAHHFRPPSEFPMPLQNFFESRIPSQWTRAEDNDLKSLVREYTYNWSFISSMLSTSSTYASGAERRTPWECFERWITLEGLPADMQKTHYFRHYNSRIEAAQRALMVASAQVAQTQGASVPNQPPRRKNTSSVSVEQRRNQKHLSMVEAMRKGAKKRENALQKQQHAATLAQNRRAQEQPTPKTTVHTPQDFSRLKYEREEQHRERMSQQQQRQEAFRRVRTTP